MRRTRMPKYIFERTSLVTETFTVIADSEDEALDLVRDGGPTVKVGPMVWSDWYDEEYSLDSVEDELVTFLQSKLNPRYIMTQEEKDQIIAAGSII
jgi:tagatose-1,6-bisphosphate aldolase non-catalytic subunit AgaZ/GatZ